MAPAHARSRPPLDAVDIERAERRKDCLHDFRFGYRFAAADDLPVQRIFFNKFSAHRNIRRMKGGDPLSLFDKIVSLFYSETRAFKQFRNVFGNCRSG